MYKMDITMNSLAYWITLLIFMETVERLSSSDVLGLDLPRNDILRYQETSRDPQIDLNTVCRTYPGLTVRQYDLCSQQPDVTASGIQGIQIAIHECQSQFKHHRWNCSSLEKRNKNPHSSLLLKKGFRETAFAYAISAAGVTSQVARACSLGKLESCGCQAHLDSTTNQWQWAGCQSVVFFGEKFAKEFLDSREDALDLQSRMNLHNNRAGRLAVRRNAIRSCKCHGMSGSCELKTCWNNAPTFKTVGEMLKRKYKRAAKVQIDNTNSAGRKGRQKSLRILEPAVYTQSVKQSRNKQRSHSRKQRRRQPKRRSTSSRPHSADLVYFERSPNYCDLDMTLESFGTTGRFCNRTSSGLDNCDTLCCGRGYNTLRVTRTERCNCRFHWCCYVKCETCTFDEWVTVCK